MFGVYYKGKEYNDLTQVDYHYEFVIREAKKFFMALIEKYLIKGDSNGN